MKKVRFIIVNHSSKRLYAECISASSGSVKRACSLLFRKKLKVYPGNYVIKLYYPDASLELDRNQSLDESEAAVHTLKNGKHQGVTVELNHSSGIVKLECRKRISVIELIQGD